MRGLLLTSDTRRSMYIVVTTDGSAPNKAYSRLENANRINYNNDAVEIYRHKKRYDDDYSCVPDETSVLCAKREISPDDAKKRATHMKNHFEKYIYIAHNPETSEYRQFTRTTNMEIFIRSNAGFNGYKMLRDDWNTHGVLYNESQVPQTSQ
jgi:hypothetical protein